MKRIYISGKITGTDDYMERFDEAEQLLKRAGYKSIVNPASVASMLPDDFTHREYMLISLAELSTCSEICLLDDWYDSEGAKMEARYALEHGYTIRTKREIGEILKDFYQE